MHQAIACGAQVETLVNMKVEGGDRSRSHGLRSGVIAAQARALGMRLDGVPASVALPHTQWLYEYLGMVPVAVDPLDGDSSLGGDLRRLLARMDCTRVWKSASFRHADCVFADGATLAVLSTTPEGPAGIEIALPSRGHVDIVEKCVLGAEGALHILEWLLNALIKD